MSVARFGYLAGAVADAVIGVLLLLPETLAQVLGLAGAPTGGMERLALAMTATMLFGWTGLLLWGAASPVERRGVLALTIFPVIVGLALAVLYGWRGLLISGQGAFGIWLMQALLVVLLTWAYMAAHRMARNLASSGRRS
jgi:hypothetical protein